MEEEGKAIAPRMDDEEQEHVAQGKIIDAEEGIYSDPRPLSDKSQESEKKTSEDSSDLHIDVHALPDPVSGGGKDDLPSESEVDLGQGIPEKCDYPGPSYEEYLKEELDEYKAFLDETKKPGMTIESQMPKPPRTIEEEALYTHVLRKSDYFEVPSFFQSGPSVNQWNPKSSELLDLPLYKRFVDYCKQAIDEYNKKEGTRYELKYLIKMCDNLYEFNVTFALTDPEHRPYVGRVKMVLPYGRTATPVIDPMKVTRGEYRAPHWTDAKGKEYKCVVNEKCREKLSELEKEWRCEKNLD